MAANPAGVVTYASILKEIAGNASLRDDFRFIRPADRLKFVKAERPSKSPKVGEHLSNKLLVGTLTSQYPKPDMRSRPVYAYVHKQKYTAKYPQLNHVTFVAENGEGVLPGWVHMGFDIPADGYCGRMLPSHLEKLRFMVLFYFLEVGLLESFPQFGKGLTIFTQCCQTIAELVRKEGKGPFRTEQTLSLKRCILSPREQQGKNGSSDQDGSSPSSTLQPNLLHQDRGTKPQNAPIQDIPVPTRSPCESQSIVAETNAKPGALRPAITPSKKRPRESIEGAANVSMAQTGSGDEMSGESKKAKTHVVDMERRLQDAIASYKSSTKELEATKDQLKLATRQKLDKEEAV